MCKDTNNHSSDSPPPKTYAPMITFRSWSDFVIRQPVNNDPVTMDNASQNQNLPPVSSQDNTSGSNTMEQEVHPNNNSRNHASQPLALFSVFGIPNDCGMNDLTKLVASCNPRSTSGIENNSFSNVRVHDFRPAKRLRTENHETEETQETRIPSSIMNQRSRASEINNGVRTANVEVCPQNRSMGLGLRKKDVVESIDIRKEHSDNVGLEESNKVVGVSMIDSLTGDEINEHILSLGKVANEADNPGEGVCSLCDMNKLLFNPIPIYCTDCLDRIKRNSFYYWTSDEVGKKHCFCSHCFKKSKGHSISVQGLSICKSSFNKGKNIEEVEEETWVQCDKCEGWQHQICGLYNSENDSDGKAKYICPPCRLQEIRVGEHMPMWGPFGAKDLQCTKLSDHIEKRLHRRLKEERLERAISSGKCVDEVPGAENLVVRVVVSANKLVKVKQQFLDIFHGKNYPSEIPYKSKMILLFQKIKGVNVCLLAMYVQEYGSDCHPTNQRSVYLSYIDSVNHFQPQIRTVHGEALRTFVYHEILIGYLDYCKKLGFETCYIWACPPVKCEDYILHCHPESQKTPKNDKLRKWYKSMLLKASEENIVEDTTNFYDRFFVPNAQFEKKVTTANFPYFDGAYWTVTAEELYMRFEKEPRKSGESTKTLMSKRALKSMGHDKLSGELNADIFVMQMLGQRVFPIKEDFIIVDLQFRCLSCHKFILSPNHWHCTKCKSFRVCPSCINVVPEFGEKTHLIDGEDHELSQIVVSGVPENTDDEDVVLDNGILENRNSFLSLCQKNHYQFDSLRRAKYSSMIILHHLHKHESTQRSCVTDTKNKRMQKKKMDLKKKEEILKTLRHALQCKPSIENPCSCSKCCNVKKLFNHMYQCKRRASGGCELCKRVWNLLHLHSRNCTVADCRVPRCQDIKISRNLETTQVDDVRRAAMEGD